MLVSYTNRNSTTNNGYTVCSCSSLPNICIDFTDLSLEPDPGSKAASEWAGQETHMWALILLIDQSYFWSHSRRRRHRHARRRTLLLLGTHKILAFPPDSVYLYRSDWPIFNCHESWRPRCHRRMHRREPIYPVQQIKRGWTIRQQICRSLVRMCLFPNDMFSRLMKRKGDCCFS